ncbi:MAG: hypothetical protein ABIK98_09280 [Pseudomonadota bacterium]|uniref:Uncharacterized protein n=1 Tax=Candidatus Desulfatibia profunda TaxID=2841695 RepID=A0A8J6TJ16_9BACT|nr:hypothetical protein [Candidatus Desulfatibia profunda]MBU0699004.1 hypothetical protein [Pseudomonadota bacterium]
MHPKDTGNVLIEIVGKAVCKLPGCRTHPRNCSTCVLNQSCKLKTYIPTTVT